ncbi:MAG: HAD hydrolase family protein [Microthrixaceae bacterium]
MIRTDGGRLTGGDRSGHQDRRGQRRPRGGEAGRGRGTQHYGHAVTRRGPSPTTWTLTHPDANKGQMVTYLASHLGVPLDVVATLGDSPNDVLMFAHVGVSIAMGNAHPDVQRSARFTTETNDRDGFARAIERFVLGAS